MNWMNKLASRLAVAGCAVCFFMVAACSSAQESTIKKRFEEKVVPGKTVTAIKKTPYLGLYEVQVDNRVVYTDSKAQYLFFGRIINIDTGENYTDQRLEELNKINFRDLPLDKAIKKVHGKGERAIAVFSDPNCGYCKKLDSMLKGVDNLTIYVFPLNVLSEQSKTISRNIWCSTNRVKAWNDWMIDGVKPARAKADCKYDDSAVLKLAQQLDVNATPVIFFKDGSRIVGMPSQADFMEALNDQK